MMSRALELSWGAQVVACVVYAFGLLGRRGGGGTAARVLLGAAWVLAAVALGSRWLAAGLFRPPWLSLPEIMVFGAWALLTLQLIGEFRQSARLTGFFCTALAAAAVGTVIFKMGGLGRPVPAHPAFTRPWLWIHLPSGVTGYGLMLIAAFFSILGRVRSGVATERFLTALGGVMLASLALLLPKAIEARVALAALAGFVAFSCLGFWLESLDQRLVAEREQSGGKNAKLPARRGWWRLARWIFAVSWVLYLVALGKIEFGHTPEYFAWLSFLAALGVGALWLVKNRKQVQARLPELESLDDWSSQAALLAFPWLTFHLVSGSIWAYEVWGSYWSWQPGQSRTLVAWLYLAFMLHLKPGKVSTHVVRAASVIWVIAAIAAGGAHGFWPVRF